MNEFRNPGNADVRDKPIVDLSRPHSNIREQDWVMRHGNGVGMWGWNSVNHFIYVPEVVPYIQSYSSRECCFYIYGIMVYVYANWYVGRQSAGQMNMFNPRTKWAHSVVFWTGLIRLHMAWLIGCVGYFYSYEFLYTYVPPFKIRDPSPEGWKRCFDDGQSTFLARFAASIFPAIGYAVWKGGVKKMYVWWGFTWVWSVYFEAGRPFFTGSLLGLQSINHYENERVGRVGSLNPEMERRIDPDTNRPFWISQFETFRFSVSPIIDEVQKVGHDYQPMKEMNLKMRNPYFNFQKAPQLHRDSPLRYKSDIFRLPEVLEAKTLSGAWDRDKCDPVKEWLIQT